MAHLITRRAYIVTGCLIVTMGSTSSRYAFAQARPLIGFFRSFMERVGAPVITATVTDMIREWRVPRLAQAAQSANQMMASGGFTDMSQARVHATGGAQSDPQTTATYAAQNTNHADICTPFIENGRLVQLLEGPGILGLSSIADIYRLNRTDARDYLVPRLNGQNAEGSLAEGYNRPARFHSDRAQVSINYRNNNHRTFPNGAQSGEGVVRVAAYDRMSGQGLFDREMPIEYRYQV